MSLASSASRAGAGHHRFRHLVFGITAGGVYKTSSQRQYVGANGPTSDR
jgi:hypothetical protein